MGFSLVCLLTTAILDSFFLFFFFFLFFLIFFPFSYSNFLTLPPQEMGGPILLEYGHQDLSGYFLLNWDSKGALGNPLLLVLRLRVLISVSNQGWMIFSLVSCSFIYPCWTGTARCSLLTWAEKKWVRQLIIHGAIISSINMMITGTSRDISQLQVLLHQQKDPLKRDSSHTENSPAHSLRSYKIWMFFLRTVRFSLFRWRY